MLGTEASGVKRSPRNKGLAGVSPAGPRDQNGNQQTGATVRKGSRGWAPGVTGSCSRLAGRDSDCPLPEAWPWWLACESVVGLWDLQEDGGTGRPDTNNSHTGQRARGHSPHSVD